MNEVVKPNDLRTVGPKGAKAEAASHSELPMLLGDELTPRGAAPHTKLIAYIIFVRYPLLSG